MPFITTGYLPLLVEIMFQLETTELTSIPKKNYCVDDTFVIKLLFRCILFMYLVLDTKTSSTTKRYIITSTQITWKLFFSISYYFPSTLT